MGPRAEESLLLRLAGQARPPSAARLYTAAEWTVPSARSWPPGILRVKFRNVSPGALGPASRLRRRYADAPAGCPLNRSRRRRVACASLRLMRHFPYRRGIVGPPRPWGVKVLATHNARKLPKAAIFLRSGSLRSTVTQAAPVRAKPLRVPLTQGALCRPFSDA
jgi:hypothetical protein